MTTANNTSKAQREDFDGKGFFQCAMDKARAATLDPRPDLAPEDDIFYQFFRAGACGA